MQKLTALTLLAVVALTGCSNSNDTTPSKAPETPSVQTSVDSELAAAGKPIFRYETFGDESFWTDELMMNQVVESAVDPMTALSVGLKVDAAALPDEVVAGVMDGSVSLTDPATTLALLKLDAVVGLKGTIKTVEGKDRLEALGVTCALCHSTVDDSFAPGIGVRLDGWPNRDLNPGAIIALSPAVPDDAKAVYNAWGPGMYDPRFNLDGKNGPQVIPPAYGLLGVARITATGDGDNIEYWNRYVAVTQMGGHGTFTEKRTGVNVTNGSDDLVTDKLPALQEYQLSLPAPPPADGVFDADAAARGEKIFSGAGKCNSCHSGRLLTDADSRLHDATEVVSEPEPGDAPSYASRSATRRYRTTPLRALWQHPPYFHNGSAATLEDVVSMYNDKKSLGLSADQQADLASYLKSL